jgi:cellobiose phosphorylase
MYRVAYDYIMGVRPTYRGLLIDPVVPPDWNRFRVERVFRVIQRDDPEGLIHYGFKFKLC